MRLRFAAALAVGTTVATIGMLPTTANASDNRAFVARLHTTATVASTVPDNGDINPYGVAVVTKSRGRLFKDNVLVSNFNNSGNVQGTGSTIVEVSPNGSVQQFAQIDTSDCPGGVGLTTALVVLRQGWVIVGSLPADPMTGAITGTGCLIVLDSFGNVRETISGHGINGPWDMTANDSGNSADLFVTNVLNGTVAANGATVNEGTVLRLGLSVSGDQPPSFTGVTEIGSNFPERTDAAALVVGPTGVGLAPNGVLYVADSLDNRISAIPNALRRTDSDGTGQTVTSDGSLNTPLGLAIAPNHDILTVNAGDGNLVETTPGGAQIAVRNLVPPTEPAAGTLFGLAVVRGPRAIYYVDDAANLLNVLH